MEPLARPVPDDALPLDATGRIDTDVTCRKCGYNLRGLLPDGVCPECATAVGRSLHGDLLRFCDPDWVQRLASGMNWIVAGIVAGVVLGCLGGGAMGLAGAFRVRAALDPLPVIALQFISSLVSFVGYWKLTTPDPGRTSVEAAWTARKLVRVAQLVALVATPASGVLRAAPPLIVVPVTAATSIISVIGVFAIFAYARQLARRIPDDRLARNTRIVMWGVVACVVLFAIVAVAAAAVAATAIRAGPPAAFTTTMSVTKTPGRVWRYPPGTTLPATTTMAIGSAMPVGLAFASFGVVFGIGGCAACLCALVFGIWSLRLIDRYRKALRESAEIARRTWAAQAGPAG